MYSCAVCLRRRKLKYCCSVARIRSRSHRRLRRYVISGLRADNSICATDTSAGAPSTDSAAVAVASRALAAAAAAASVCSCRGRRRCRGARFTESHASVTEGEAPKQSSAVDTPTTQNQQRRPLLRRQFHFRFRFDILYRKSY